MIESADITLSTPALGVIVAVAVLGGLLIGLVGPWFRSARLASEITLQRVYCDEIIKAFDSGEAPALEMAITSLHHQYGNLYGITQGGEVPPDLARQPIRPFKWQGGVVIRLHA